MAKMKNDSEEIQNNKHNSVSEFSTISVSNVVSIISEKVAEIETALDNVVVKLSPVLLNNLTKPDVRKIDIKGSEIALNLFEINNILAALVKYIKNLDEEINV